MAEEPQLLLHWEKTLGDLLDRTQKFPKAVRFTFAGRIDGHALDVLELLTEARWARAEHKRELLARADITLAKLRTLVRISHDRRYLDHRGLEQVVRNLDEAGRMLGGWLRQQGPR